MKTKLKFTLTALMSLLLAGNLMAQETFGQVVRGIIIDVDSETPLIGASIILVDSDPLIGTTTDFDGAFVLENVPIGRQSFEVSYLGYLPRIVNNVLVGNGKEVVLDISMEESLTDLEEVVITAKKDKKKAVNSMAAVSARSIHTEEIMRFSGGRNDISRLAGNFAGVSTADDSRNDIVIRGNSPTGLLWRMEGVPIPNPNHFATLGTTGGPVSAVNTNMLATSDFMTSAFPAEYGNATSGVMDVKLRSGNKEKLEFTAQVAAFSGLEFMAEGPLSRKNLGSWLISYRYALTAIAPTGTSATPKYQDLTFKLDLPASKAGKFSLFGLNGYSKINFLGESIDANDLFANPNEDAYVKSGLGIMGLNHSKMIGEDAYIKSAISVSSTTSKFDQDNYLENGDKIDVTHVNDQTKTIALSSYYNNKVNSRFTFRTGVLAQVYKLSTVIDDRTETPDWIRLRDFDGTMSLVEVYLQSKTRLSDRFTLHLGAHGQVFTLNNSWAVEPRAALEWQAGIGHKVTLGYGLHSQIQPFPVYFYEEEQPDGTYAATNKDLDFTGSHHFVLGYEYAFRSDWRLKTEAYYQYITGAPVEKTPSSFSILNAGADFVFPERGSLVNEGKGYNYGLEVTLEKFFSKGYYGLLTGTVYSSRYKGSDGIERNTAFNNTYVLNFLAGKEFKIGKEKRNAFLMDVKLTTAGGRYYTPVDLNASVEAGEEVLFEESAYSLRYKPYFRMDFKAGVRLNGKKRNVSQEFFFDLQNITNRTNTFVKRYNELTNEVNTVAQTGIFPDVLYRIRF